MRYMQQGMLCFDDYYKYLSSCQCSTGLMATVQHGGTIALYVICTMRRDLHSCLSNPIAGRSSSPGRGWNSDAGWCRKGVLLGIDLQNFVIWSFSRDH